MKSNNDQNHKMIQVDKEIESQVTREHAQFEKEAEELGGQLAEKKRPRLVGDTLNPYIQVLAGKYLSLYGAAKKLLQTGQEDRFDREDQEFATEQQKKNDHKISELKHGLHIQKVEQQRIGPVFPPRKQLFSFLAVFGLGLLEGLIDTRAIQQMSGDNFLISLIWGMGIGLSTALAASPYAQSLATY